MYVGRSLTMLPKRSEGANTMGCWSLEKVEDSWRMSMPMNIHSSGSRISHATPKVSRQFYLYLLMINAVKC